MYEYFRFYRFFHSSLWGGPNDTLAPPFWTLGGAMARWPPPLGRVGHDFDFQNQNHDFEIKIMIWFWFSKSLFLGWFWFWFEIIFLWMILILRSYQNQNHDFDFEIISKSKSFFLNLFGFLGFQSRKSWFFLTSRLILLRSEGRGDTSIYKHSKKSWLANWPSPTMTVFKH